MLSFVPKSGICGKCYFRTLAREKTEVKHAIWLKRPPNNMDIRKPHMKIGWNISEIAEVQKGPKTIDRAALQTLLMSSGNGPHSAYTTSKAS